MNVYHVMMDVINVNQLMIVKIAKMVIILMVNNVLNVQLIIASNVMLQELVHSAKVNFSSIKIHVNYAHQDAHLVNRVLVDNVLVVWMDFI
jgi:hypothetical protein